MALENSTEEELATWLSWRLYYDLGRELQRDVARLERVAQVTARIAARPSSQESTYWAILTSQILTYSGDEVLDQFLESYEKSSMFWPPRFDVEQYVRENTETLPF
jgi:hypothetical protein